MTGLERRYLRLIRLFYPARYRQERGTEIAGTYLAMAAPGRRWPSPADVADLAAGGLRERVRAAGATGLGPGIRLAASPALLMTTLLAGVWTVMEAGIGLSLGTGVWAAWLLVPVVYLARPGRWTRVATGAALAVTVASVPLAAVTGGYRPALFVLLPQLALGLVVLGLPGDGTHRWPAPAAAVALLPAALSLLYEDGYLASLYYGRSVGQALPVAGLLLLLIAVLLAAGLGLRGDFRGLWALLVLLGPIGMLVLHPLAEDLSVRLYGGGPNASFATLLASAVAVAVLAPVPVLLALLVRAPRPRASERR